MQLSRIYFILVLCIITLFVLCAVTQAMPL
jgi:hypothetical protein